jgi:adenine-specific DNA-methyltransferase
MKTRAEVTAEKLRGGFYTPAPLVGACLERLRALVPAGDLAFLEPSAGDGAFLRALGQPEWRRRVMSVTAIEPHEVEAEKCRRSLSEAGLRGDVRATSVIPWAASDSGEMFDAAVGNPPFVRYQFISASDRSAILRLGAKLKVEFAGVANLWIPVLLAALARLRPGGAFAFVIPTECLTGCSAGAVRAWLLAECASLRFDLFPPGSFPEVLQEIAVLSGRRSADAGGGTIALVDHAGGVRKWSHRVQDSRAWTRYLLDPPHLQAVEEAQQLPFARPLGELVRFAVGIVTGATGYFSVDDVTLAEFGLGEWARPLLPRLRYAPGLVFTLRDLEAARRTGAKTWLLDFAADKRDPRTASSPAEYLRLGEQMQLHERYKCRIRDPWYRVPGIVRGELFLSKRSHLWPRVVVNSAGAYTTDTIYRGRMVATDRVAGDIAATFQNTLTLLTAELEGRSFGGGVHELVPSEIARLTMLTPAGSQEALAGLDAVARTADPKAVVDATDAYLVGRGALPADLLPILAEARELLAARRFERNRRETDEHAGTAAAA